MPDGYTLVQYVDSLRRHSLNRFVIFTQKGSEKSLKSIEEFEE